MRPEGPWHRRLFYSITLSYPGRARAVIVGPPRLLPDTSCRKKKKKNKRKRQRESTFWGGPEPPSSPSLSDPSSLPGLSTISSRSSSFPCTPKRARPGIIPTLVSLRKSSTAGVARASRERRRTEGALGPPHSQSSSTLYQSRLIPGVHLLHRMKWCLVCLSPVPHHQHLSLGAWPSRYRWGAMAVWPDRSW